MKLLNWDLNFLMENKIIVVREENQDWLKSEEQGELRWKLLVDSSIGSSSGLSLGLLKIKPNYELPLHHHNPNEIYLIKRGTGLLIKSKTSIKLKTGDAVYIPKNAVHGIRNTGPTSLLLYWVFPTDSWEEVKYNFVI